MAKVKMQKIEMIALLKDSKSIVERLQRRGVMEFFKSDDEGLITVDTNSIINQFDRNIESAKNALDILNKYSNKKASMFESLNGRKAVTTDEFGEKKEFIDKIIGMSRYILDCSKKIGDCNSEIAKLKTRSDTLMPWSGLDVPQNFKGTKTTRCYIGTLTYMLKEDEICAKLLELDENAVAEAEVVSSRKEQTCVAVFCHKSVEDAVFSSLRNMGFVQLSGVSRSTFYEEIKDIEKSIAGNIKNISYYEQEIEKCDGSQEYI